MKTYWAADKDENIAKNILAKFDDYKQFLLENGEIQKLRKSYKTFYGSTEIENIDQSLKAIRVNNYASLIRNLHVMVTSQRPAWQPRAINSDLESQASADLAEGLLDFYMREKGLEKKINDATLMALFLKEGWLVCDWDVNAGQPIAFEEESGQTVFEGDLSVTVHSMLDVARDVYSREKDQQWYIVRKFKNKYDMAETFPELAEKLISLSDDSQTERSQFDLRPILTTYGEGINDLIPIYVLYHDKTPALPEGRLVVVASDDCILFDGPLPYKKPYVFCITPGWQYETGFGHSNMFDLLPLQDALDANFSAIVTNQSANAVQNFQVPKGSGLNVTKVMDGMNVLEYDPKLGPIQPLELLRTAPEVFSFNETLNNYMQLLPNIGSVARGDAPASMSGAAMALLQQQTIQSSSGLQLSHTLLLENLGTAIIELLQEFAVEPRLAVIAGKTKKPLMKMFSGSDLQGVNRVIVDSANPLTKTSAGRVEIANQLLQTPGMIKSPEQYISVLTTGNLEPIYELEKSRQYLIRDENESLMQGEVPKAVLTDDHQVHILEHSCVINNLNSRKDPNIVANVLSHIQEHLDLAKQMTPELAAMLKQQSFAPPPPPPQPGPGPVMNPQTPLEQQVSDVNLPKPAQSPLPPMQ